MNDRTQYDPEAERLSLPARWEQQNGPAMRAIGGAIDAVKHARRADWTLDELVERVRAEWALADRLAGG